MTIFITHGTQFGQGIHSIAKNGALKVFVNGVLIHTFTCTHRVRGLPGYYPEPVPLLTHEIPVDLRSNGIADRELTIKFEASPRTCMDFQSMRIAPEFGRGARELPVPPGPMRRREIPENVPVPPQPFRD